MSQETEQVKNQLLTHIFKRNSQENPKKHKGKRIPFEDDSTLLLNGKNQFLFKELPPMSEAFEKARISNISNQLKTDIATCLYASFSKFVDETKTRNLIKDNNFAIHPDLPLGFVITGDPKGMQAMPKNMLGSIKVHADKILGKFLDQNENEIKMALKIQDQIDQGPSQN